MTEQSVKKPAKIFKCNNARVAIFKNYSDAGYAIFNVMASTSYKDGDEWKWGTSFTAKDCLVIAHLLTKAADWVVEEESREAANYAIRRNQRKKATRRADSPEGSIPADNEEAPF